METFIVWNEDMTEGVIFTDRETAHDCAMGEGDNDLAEYFSNANRGDVLTVDMVQMQNRTN